MRLTPRSLASGLIMSSASVGPPAGQPLAGQAAVVTGSSSGIGRAIALELARAGASVIVHAGSNRGGADEVAATITQSGSSALVLMADLVDDAAQDRLVARAWGWKPIDIWVNNAGADVLTGERRHAGFEQKLDRLWQVDVRAAVRLSRDVGRRMKERGHGVIINMSWDQVAWGQAGESGEMFAAAKGAIEAFSRSLARTLAPEVRVNCLAPGWIRTAWGRAASDYWQQRAVDETLRARWGTPDDVARAACFLASASADFITGQTLNVNGGFRGQSPPA